MNDQCNTIVGTVEIQENGIIRDACGYIIGRLNQNVQFDSLVHYQTKHGESKSWLLSTYRIVSDLDSICISVDEP